MVDFPVPWDVIRELGAGVITLLLLALLLFKTWRDNTATSKVLGVMHRTIDGLNTERERDTAYRVSLLAELKQAQEDRYRLAEQINQMSNEIVQLRMENEQLKEQVSKLYASIERRRQGMTERRTLPHS